MFFLICLIIAFTTINPINCDDWAEGLNNSYIENDINLF